MKWIKVVAVAVALAEAVCFITLAATLCLAWPRAALSFPPRPRQQSRKLLSHSPKPRRYLGTGPK